jgi:hypothetical protein
MHWGYADKRPTIKLQFDTGQMPACLDDIDKSNLLPFDDRLEVWVLVY